jgi:hypothetical protein
MSENCNRLNANLKLQGQPCVSCTNQLALGDPAAQCTACSAVHHAGCWDSSGGCATSGCANAPLKRLDEVAPAMQARAGYQRCPHCNSEIMASDSICPMCNSITSPDGIYHGPMENAPGAVASLVCGIIGLLVCGVILGPIAIVMSNKAKRNIAADPRYTGGGLATAGLVLGIIDVSFFVIYLMITA